MRFRDSKYILLLLLALGCSGLRPPAPSGDIAAPRGTVISEGYFDCFEKGLTIEDRKLVSCEISAVAFAGGQLDIGNDKSVPGGSPLASIPWQGPHLASSPTPVNTDLVKGVNKYEAATTTPDGKWVLATTAFDRVQPDSADWNSFNTLLFWPAGAPEKARIAHSSTVDGYESSIVLRAGVQQALADDQFPDGPPYFKIEALAAVPGGRLLLGIREVGQDYHDFTYTAHILSIGYSMDGDELRLEEPFRKVYTADLLSETRTRFGPLGISSLEYDRFHDRLYLLTSFENGKRDVDLGAYLWVLPMADFESARPPILVDDHEGRPFLFAHKAEGLAVIDAETLIIVHDDDGVFGHEPIDDARRNFHREPQQAAWTVLRVE